MLVVKGPVPLEDILYQVKKSGRICPLQIVSGDMVLDEDHVDHAKTLAMRAMDEGRNQADSVEVEFVRYLSGERQIRKALNKVGANDACETLAVIGFGEKAMDAEKHFAHALGLPETTLPARDKKWLLQWGIDEASLSATTPDRALDLILERVAAVELMK